LRPHPALWDDIQNFLLIRKVVVAATNIEIPACRGRLTLFTVLLKFSTLLIDHQISGDERSEISAENTGFHAL
jgi:hypothetical protein